MCFKIYFSGYCLVLINSESNNSNNLAVKKHKEKLTWNSFRKLKKVFYSSCTMTICYKSVMFVTIVSQKIPLVSG